MILFFDTETTGFPDRRLPPDHECQPHLVQVACLLIEDDGTERAGFNLIVNPLVPIPASAAAIHGIDDAVADRCGVSNPTAVAMWDRLAERADMLVAHNIGFDLALIETAWLRVGSKAKPNLDAAHGGRARFCTMDAATPILNLPPTERMLKAGFNKPKPPKLEECIQHFFNEPLPGAHDALADVRACARVFFHLKSLERVAA